ncbi:hypothetical protein LIER_11503 [Lithospermum erythrorhizon]|uniref:Uncharacterized protein n=1 Tax=Lithospermum erythrorhizon TaxID=34254 RepID=A0AAV3PQ72_LITER
MKKLKSQMRRILLLILESQKEDIITATDLEGPAHGFITISPKLMQGTHTYPPKEQKARSSPRQAEEPGQKLAEVARIEFARKTFQGFMSSPDYKAKVGGECAAYLAHLAIHYKEMIPKLTTLFASEQLSHPNWFESFIFGSAFHLGEQKPSYECSRRRGWRRGC